MMRGTGHTCELGGIQEPSDLADSTIDEPFVEYQINWVGDGVQREIWAVHSSTKERRVSLLVSIFLNGLKEEN